jgi:glycosyltransferase involved in cell wall biosynthesis
MRYLWGFQDVYFNRCLAPVRLLMNAIFHFLKAWDLKTNERVDLFVANSEYIKKRIKTVYRRDAVVVHPPLEAGFFKPVSEHTLQRDSPGLRDCPSQNFYLAVSHFVPYKRLDLVIEAFNRLERRLVVIGSGPLAAQYQKFRKSDRISFWGSVSDEELRKAYAGARALIFPTEEDFGIVPLEAQACGTPVIAFRKGGALETVKSGVFFDEQTPEAIHEAVVRFEHKDFDRLEVSGKVQGFGRKCFLENMKKIVGTHFMKRIETP